jgi:Phage integrase family
MASPARLAKDFLLLRAGGRFALFQTLRLALADAAKRAGCTDTKPISPHRLRHTWATELLNCGIGLPVLMKLMGHKSIQMTLRYLRVAQPDLQREFYRARQNSPQCTVSPRSPSLRLLQIVALVKFCRNFCQAMTVDQSMNR